MTQQHINQLSILNEAKSNVYRKITWRIMPFIVLCYLCAYLDRVNVGFAKLQMMSDLNLSNVVYGLGAGMFFIGYFIFEVPSNIILQKVGARIWIARIMITWAIISAATLFVKTPTQFYIARFLLGAAEAGFSPGIMLYLTYWFPSKKRGFALGFYYIAIPLAGVVGGPFSGWILDAFSQSKVMSSWQWLLLIEAIPSLVVGIAVLSLMVDRPEKASWLSEEEKRHVIDEISKEDSLKTEHSGSLSFLSDRRLWKLCLVYFCQIIGLYGVSFWIPTIIQSSGIDNNTVIGWLSAVPYLVAIPVIILTGISADRYRSRRMHFSALLIIGAIGLAFSGYIGHNVALTIIGLSVGTAGTLSALSLFWGIPTSFLSGTSVAVGIAAINSVGNLAGFISPYMVGWLIDYTGNISFGLYAVAAFMIVGALMVRMISGHDADK